MLKAIGLALPHRFTGTLLCFEICVKAIARCRCIAMRVAVIRRFGVGGCVHTAGTNLAVMAHICTIAMPQTSPLNHSPHSVLRLASEGKLRGTYQPSR